MRSFSVFVLFVVSLAALPVVAQGDPASFNDVEIYFSHMAGPQGEGVDLRLPRFRVPPGLDGEYVIDFVPKIKLVVAVDDAQGNPIATIDDLEYPSSGLTLKFTTGDIVGDYAQLLLNDEPTGGELPVSSNGRVEYTAELLVLITPELVRDEDRQGISPGSGVPFLPHVVVYSLATGATVATGHIKVKPLKGLKEALN